MRFKPSASATVGPGSYFHDKSAKGSNNKNNGNLFFGDPHRKTIFSVNDKNPGPG